MLYRAEAEFAEATLMRTLCETKSADPQLALKAQRIEAKAHASKEVQPTFSLIAAMSCHDINARTITLRCKFQ